MLRIYTSALLTLFILGTSFAQTPQLVSDLNPSGNGLDEFETSFLTIGSKTILVANNGQTGLELFVLEGNSLSLLKDIIPGNISSLPEYLTLLDNKVYFVASDSAHGREIWFTDGTPGGTTIAHDLLAGPNPSNPVYLFASESGQLFFESNHKLYAMTPGSSPVLLNPPSYVDLEPDYATLGKKMVSFKDGIVFATHDANFADSTEIWISNGTPAGTKRLAVYISSFGGAYGLMALEDKVLFTIENEFSPEDVVNGLYATTGLPGGTTQILAAPGQGNAKLPQRFLPVDNSIAYFYTSGGMYATNGTVAGTIKLTANLQSFLTQGEPYPFASLAGKALFTAEGGSFTEPIYLSNGTVAGTSILKTIDENFVEQFVRYRNKIFFVSGVFNGFTPKIWESNLTAVGTKSIYTYPNTSASGPSIIILGFIDNFMYFQSNLGGVGRELYRIQIDIGASTSNPGAITNTYTLHFSPQNSMGSVVSDNQNERLILRLYDVQGRELQQMTVLSGEIFNTLSFPGLGILTVQGEQGIQSFKVLGN